MVGWNVVGQKQMLDWAACDGPFEILKDKDGNMHQWDLMGEQGYCGRENGCFIYEDGLLQPLLDFIFMLHTRLCENGRAFIFTPYCTDPLNSESMAFKMCTYLKAKKFSYMPLHYTSGGKSMQGKVNNPNQIMHQVWLVWHTAGKPLYYPNLGTMDFKFANLLVRKY